MAQAGRKLACDLINDQFGEHVQKVCDCLITRGQLQLADIDRNTGISLQQVRNCLLVLIQHNCVQAFKVEHEGASGGDPKPYYIAIVDNILHRMRFPKFLMLVREELGKEAEGLVSGLLLHGRLTLEQLIQRTVECGQTSDSDVDMSLRETFASLVRAHFVELCPAPEPMVGISKERPGKISRTNKSPEERVVSAAAMNKAERFRVPASLEQHPEDKDIEMESELSTGQKRKRGAPEMDSNTRSPIEEWRVNYEEFVRRLRHQACVKFVRSKTDLGTGTILSCMLNATRHCETMVRESVSDALTMEDITRAMMEEPESRTMSEERTRAGLQQMMTAGFVDNFGDEDNQYVVNMKGIIELARRHEVEGIVLQRYGQKCCRLFKLLNIKGRSEHKQISDKSMLPVKEAWELLDKLAREKYVQRQEIPKTADRCPGETCYMWSVNPSIVARNVLSDMYHAAWNLGRRLAHELEQEQEFLSLPKRNSAALTQAQQDQANRLSNIAKVLETSLLKLDDALLLFHDF